MFFQHLVEPADPRSFRSIQATVKTFRAVDENFPVSAVQDFPHHPNPALKIIAVDKMHKLTGKSRNRFAVDTALNHAVRQDRHTVCGADHPDDAFIPQHGQTMLQIFDPGRFHLNGIIMPDRLGIYAAQHPDRIRGQRRKKGNDPAGQSLNFRHSRSGSPYSADQILLFRQHGDDFIHRHFVDGKFIRQSGFRRETRSRRVNAVFQPLFQFPVNPFRNTHSATAFHLGSAVIYSKKCISQVFFNKF